MDWELAIERNREALKRVVAMLVAMAAITVGSGEPRKTLPRHLHRAILRLLRPAESAVRRLVIVAARGLVVTLAPSRPRKPKPRPTILRNGIGTGIVLPAGFAVAREAAGDRGPAVSTLPLFDPIRRFNARPKRPVATGVPRVSLPGVTAQCAVTPRKPPAPYDPLDATRLALRLSALGATLDDLPRQARRFARWRALRDARNRDATGVPQQNRRARRIAPLRPGRPPGHRPARRRTHDVHDILHDLHGLAFDVLEHPTRHDARDRLRPTRDRMGTAQAGPRRRTPSLLPLWEKVASPQRSEGEVG